jgi:hypothetical protein
MALFRLPGSFCDSRGQARIGRLPAIPLVSVAVDWVVERTLHGKKWRIALILPQTLWEDLFRWNAPYTSTKSAWDAYQHAHPFWDALAERNADEASGETNPDSPVRQIEAAANSLPWLEAEYARYQRHKVED